MKQLRNPLILAGLAATLLAGRAVCGSIFDTFTVPAGTSLHAVLTTTLSTKANQDGDPFVAKVQDPIFYHGYEVIPAGSLLKGRVAFLRPAGRAKGKGEMRLAVDSIETPDGSRYQISAALVDSNGGNSKVKGDEGAIEGPGKSIKKAGKEVGIGAGVGAGMGGMIDGGTGLVYGAAIGALAAVVHNLAKHHEGVVLPTGTELTFVISRTATMQKVSGAAQAATSNPPSR